MDNRVNDIYSRRLRAGSRTYFFDVKVNSRDDKYLVITESRKTGPDIYQHDRVMVFEENMPNFLGCLYEALQEIGIDVTYPPQPADPEKIDRPQRNNYQQYDNEAIPRGVSSASAPAGHLSHNHRGNRDGQHRDGQRRYDNRDSGGARSPYSRQRNPSGSNRSYANGRAYNSEQPAYRSNRSHRHHDRAYSSNRAEDTRKPQNAPQRFYSTGGFDEF